MRPMNSERDTISIPTTADIAALIEDLCDAERDFGAAARMGDADGAASATVATIYAKRNLDVALAAQQAEIERLREALEPLARLELPRRLQGNAGAYSIRHDDIRRARAALNPTEPSDAA